MCRGIFRTVLNGGLLKIRFLRYTLSPILRPFFAGVVYGVSLTWAAIVRQTGVPALLGVLFFFVILALGLAYAWRKGALEWK